MSPGISPERPSPQLSSAQSWRAVRAAGIRNRRIDRSAELMADVRRPLVWGRSTYKTSPNHKDAGPWHVTQPRPDGTATGLGLCGAMFGHSERSHRFVATSAKRPTWSQRCCPECVRLERTVPPAPTEETR